MVYHAPIGYLAMTTTGIFGHDMPPSEFFPLSDMYLCIKLADDCVDETGVEEPAEFLDQFKRAILGEDVGGNGCYNDAVVKATMEILLPHQDFYSGIEERPESLKESVIADLESRDYPDFHRASIDGGRQAGGLVHSVTANITGTCYELMRTYLEELGIAANLLDNLKNYGDDTKRFGCSSQGDYIKVAADLMSYIGSTLSMLPPSMRREAIRSYTPIALRCLKEIGGFFSR